MMRRLLLLAAFLLLPSLAYSQTSTVTGHAMFPSGGASSNASVCFSLSNFKPNVPKVSGTGVIVQATNFCITPTADGSFSTPLYRNDQITPGSTYWRVDYLWNGSQQSSANYSITAATFNLDSATPLVITPLPANGLLTSSYNCQISSALSTWTCVHGFNDKNVTVTVYDANGNQIFPNTLTLTDANTVTLTWVTPQAGNAVIIHASAVAIAISQPNAVLQAPSGSQTINASQALTIAAATAHTGNNTHSGTEAFKNINAIQFADQFIASAITAPTLAPAIGNVAGGGTVANNTYACEITFQGTVGETTATPTSGTTVTGGGASSLQCGPLDVPTGAVTYNVYWQTGGAGSYFAGHTAVALNNTDSQTTTPATSGANPPVSNTATSQLAAAQGALSGGAGTIYIPSTLAASAGSAGNLSPNQSMFDFRTGTISSRIQTPNLSNQKGTIGAIPSTGWNLDYLIPTALSSFQEAVPLQVTAHLQSAGTTSYWGGINSVGGGLTTAGFGFVRDAARSENAWALTASANCNSTNGTCVGVEIDGTVNNTPVDTCSGGCNLLIGANGQRNFEGIRFTSLNGTAAYKVGIDIQPNMYTVNGLLVGGSTTAGAIGVVSFNSTPATGGAFLGQASATNPNAFMADNAVAAQPTCYVWRNAGSALWQMCQDASLNFANYDVTNGSLARFQWNTGANGANIYNTPGTGVHAFNNPIRFNEVAGSTCASDSGATFDTICGDSTLHGFVANYNNAGVTGLTKTAALTADWTCGTGGTVSSCVAATIIGSGGGVPLTFNLPLVAGSYTLECDGVVGQATAVTANQWNLLTATNGATNVTANYSMATAAAAAAFGAVTDQASTTTTFNIAPAWTLGAITTKMPFHIWAKIEGASASGTVVSFQLVAPTVADLVTIYRGASCRIF